MVQRTPGDEMRMEIQRGKERMSKTIAVIERTGGPSQLADLVDSESALVRPLGILALTVDARVTPILPDLRLLSGVPVAAVPPEYAGLNPGLVILLHSLPHISAPGIVNAIQQDNCAIPPDGGAAAGLRGTGH